MANTKYDDLIGKKAILKVRESTIVGVVKDVTIWHHDDPCFTMDVFGLGSLEVRAIEGGFTIEAA